MIANVICMVVVVAVVVLVLGVVDGDGICCVVIGWVGGV